MASGLPAYDGNRERQVLARVVEKNTGPLDQQSVTDIFSGIIRETRRLGTQRMEEQSEKQRLTCRDRQRAVSVRQA